MIMENGAFAPKDKCSFFHNIFKNMTFQRHQKAAGLGMLNVLVVQSEQHVIYRLMAGEGQGGPS